MSAGQIHQISQLSSANFAAIFGAASTEYHRATGQRLDTHPLATQLETCHSPKDISNLLRAQAQAFGRFRKGDKDLMAWLDPIVHILCAFSATLGEGIALPFSPAKVVFTGIGVLLQAVRDEIASHDTLIRLFERIHFFLQRLNSYTGMSLTDMMTELLGKIMAQLLLILALSTKAMTGGRIKKFVKRLAGRRDVEDALEELASLTTEESLMMAIRNLEVTHRVDSNVKEVKALTKVIDDDVKATKGLIHDIDDTFKATKGLTEDIRDNVRVIDDDLKATKKATNKLNRNQLRREFRTWLSPPDPSINHNTACEIQHRGTAKWFIQGGTFRKWKESGSLLWIRGNPGAGKSILCSAIIEDIKSMREATSALIAYYYFDFKDASKRDVNGLLASLLSQICDDSDSCWDVLYDLYTTCRDGSEKPSTAALAECLKTMLDLPGQVPVFVILDALDECPSTTGTPSPREKVLDFVGKLVGSNHSNLFMCITSRPEQDIQNVLNPLAPPSYRVLLHEEDGQREDIKCYVRSFVDADRDMKRWREEDRELVISVLSERADGMFRWVFCQLDTLRRCLPSSIRKALDELPTTLDDTYERALQEIPKEKRQHAHRLFQCMVVSIRPLRVEELAEILAIEFDPDAVPNLMEGWRPGNAEEAVLSACSTLIAILDSEGSKIVQFSHFSVKEFLTSDRLRTSSVGNISCYYIPLDVAHSILGQVCLIVLLQLDENVDKNRVAAFPLALYAAKYWVNHANFKHASFQFDDLMERLFDPKKPYLAAWTWIHNIDQYVIQEFDDTSPERPSPPKATASYYAAICGFSRLVHYFITTQAEDVNSSCGFFGAPLHAVSWKGHLDTARVLLGHNASVNTRGRSNFTPLHFASMGGHVKIAELLVKLGASVNARDESNWTPLHWASNRGHLEVVKFLHGHGADVPARDDKNWTPLHRASFRGHLEVVKFLLERGGDVHSRDDGKWTPLHHASDAGHLEVVKFLIKHNAAVDARDYKFWTPLHWASDHGHGEVVKFLLEQLAPVDARDNNNWTPLHWASYRGHLEVVKVVVEHGADVHVKDDKNCAPLHRASDEGRLEVVRFLVEHSAAIDARDTKNWTPLHWASGRGHREVVKFLLEQGATIDARDNDNWTPLQWALYHGQLDVIKYFFEYGTNVDYRDKNDWTLLHRASYYGHLEVVKFLLEHGADVRARDEGNWNPLHHASDAGHLEVVKLLLEHGADMDARDARKWTSLHWASEHGHLEVVQVLLERGADINAQSDTGNTPLYMASRKGCIEVVRFLLGHGADVRIQEPSGQSSLQAATAGGYDEVVQLLVDHGAGKELGTSQA